MFCFGYLKLVIPKVDHISIQRGNESPEYDKILYRNGKHNVTKNHIRRRKTEVYRLSDKWL